MQPSFETSGTISEGFVVKLDASGVVKYSTYIGGQAGAQGKAIAVDSSGRACITGTASDGFPTTSGSISGANSRGFLLELDPTGSSAVFSILGFGGSAIALDAQANIYSAGAFSNAVPTTAGAFQPFAKPTTCGSGIGAEPCLHQRVTKIDPTGTQLIYGTYITGQYGASPSSGGRAAACFGEYSRSSSSSFDHGL
jgi:hypothetical protein